MGVDVHGFNFLKFAAKQQALGRVASIGRQGLHIPSVKLRDLTGQSEQYGPYCEDLLLNHFKALSVESFDNSTYEGATYVHDFNKPLSPADTYDTVIDYGTLEHVFNVSQALSNASALCKTGGQILHALPANNYCGHGFWQFSPELFFSLYSEVNGYTETRIFAADMDDETHWYEVLKPEPGKRAELISHGPVILLVRTRKLGTVKDFSVQQSDYAHAWDTKPPAAAEHGIKDVIRRSRPLFIAAVTIRRLARKLLPLQSYRTIRLSARNKSLDKRHFEKF